MIGGGRGEDDDDVKETAEARTPAWIAAGRPRGMVGEEGSSSGAVGLNEEAFEETTTTTRRERTNEALAKENEALKERLRRMEGEVEDAWRAEMAAVRSAVVKRDTQWSRRVDRYRKLANDARAAHEMDKATWAVERATLCERRNGSSGASSRSMRKLTEDVRALRAAQRELRASAELARRLIAPAVEQAMAGIRRRES
jgi:hypothetical protein